jgi:hypothetical protein
MSLIMPAAHNNHNNHAKHNKLARINPRYIYCRSFNTFKALNFMNSSHLAPLSGVVSCGTVRRRGDSFTLFECKRGNAVRIFFICNRKFREFRKKVRIFLVLLCDTSLTSECESTQEVSIFESILRKRKTWIRTLQL